MNIVIAGGSGMLGTALNKYFHTKGHSVRILTRKIKSPTDIIWDGKDLSPNRADLEGTDIIINLSGRSIDCRHTPKNKSDILTSRINTTKAIGAIISSLNTPPKLWINASGAAIYAPSFDKEMIETSFTYATDFMAEVCKNWEDAFYNSSLSSTRQVALRTTVVLGSHGGAYPKLRQIAKLGFGGTIASGKQIMSWIHVDDYCSSVEYIINNPELSGSINISSPNPINNTTFQKELSKSVGALWSLPTPEILLRLGAKFIETEPELILNSSFVYPETLIKNGFKFNYPTINKALADLNDN